ncbi:putative NTE family protein YlbK [Paenibacillus silvae]|uniref:NTE family protein YlbK n=1 Tax=Paenibacillus silvae TaxID=1325358 RepID=A0ABQ1ZBM2_9BACL|nr:patatin-like phospholipase family protein [Paenibacillus silvae]GGH55204.1 putative NTE family protein YlbK [Paenibacillus silvae]
MKKLGLVLGGGAVRGLAHIGILKSLEKHHVAVDCIIGTSMGGVVGGLYAAGVPVHEIENTLIHTPKLRFLDRGNWLKGILAGNGIAQVVSGLLAEHELQDICIEQLPISFKTIAVDLMEGTQVMIDQGDLVTALRATSAFPGVFAPLMWNGRMLVDGGVLNNLPVANMKEENVNCILAVDVSREHEKKPPRNMVEVVYRSYSLMTAERKHSSLSLADMVVRPDVGPYAAFDVTKSLECIAAGEEAMDAMMPELQRRLASEEISLI